MVEFTFSVTLKYHAAQAYIDEDLDRVHDRLNKKIFDSLIPEFDLAEVSIEVEPT